MTKKCNHASFLLKLKCPFYCIGCCKLNKIKQILNKKRECFYQELNSES